MKKWFYARHCFGEVYVMPPMHGSYASARQGRRSGACQRSRQKIAG